jgi:hypothetical protein
MDFGCTYNSYYGELFIFAFQLTHCCPMEHCEKKTMASDKLNYSEAIAINKA